MKQEIVGKGTAMKKVIFCLFIIILILIMPFAIERIIINETMFPFNIDIAFSRESWFGFIGSYLGAIGTVLLGIIALIQNKRYKELADESNDRVLNLQKEIRDLNEKTVELIQLNSKLEHAKFYPNFTNLNYSLWREKSKVGIEQLGADVFQLTFKGIDAENFYNSSTEELYEQYYTFTYLMKNDSEHTVRNFICTEILINDDRPQEMSLLSSGCDILAGNVLACTYITKESLRSMIKNQKIYNMTFVYQMENGIGECYKMRTQLNFLINEEDDGLGFSIYEEITSPEKVKER